MTTPIINALDVAQQPPFVIGWQELDKFHRAITALYEQQTKSDREAMLLDDCLSLILRHRMASGIGIFERNEKIQGSIEEIARLLLSVADGLNTRLPETFIGQCRNSTEESASRFYQVIAEAYITPDWKKPQKNAHSDTDSEGMGNSATDGSETAPTAGQESGTNEPNKERKKPGAKETTFEDFIVNSEETESVLTIITNNIKPNNPAQAARLICGAIEAGKLSSEVTSTSIERKFGVVAASIKPHLRKYRDGGYYKDKDLKPYKDLFKA